MESIPIGRRTRLQQAIKDKELSEEKKRRWFSARSNWRKRVSRDANVGVGNNDDNDKDEEDIKVVDESEYLRRVASLKADSTKQSSSVERDQNLSRADHSQHDNVHDNSEERKVDLDNREESNVEGNDIAKDRNNEDSDDSVEIIGVRWNPDNCYESHSSGTSSGSDGEPTSIHRGAEDEVQSSPEMVAVASQQVSGFMSSSREKDRKTINEKNDHNDVCDEANVDVSGTNDDQLEGKGACRGKSRESSLDGDIFEKFVFDGLVLPMEPENNAPEDDFVGRRTRSHRKPTLSGKERGFGTFSCPMAIDDESTSSSDGDKDNSHERQNDHRPNYAEFCENASTRKRGRPPGNTYVETELDPERANDSETDNDPERANDSETDNDSEPEDCSHENVIIRKRGRPPRNTYMETEPERQNDSETDTDPEPKDCSNENASIRKRGRPPRNTYLETEPEPEPENDFETDNDPEPKDCSRENAGMRKRGRPPKTSNVELESGPQRKKQRVKTNEVEILMLNTILENGNGGLENLVPSVNKTQLPCKFRFQDQSSLPENLKEEEEEEVEGLFKDLDFALRACNVGCSMSDSGEDEADDDVLTYESAVMQEKLCHQGKHYLTVDDEIGIRCKFCSFVKLEIRNVTPAFHEDPFGRAENKYHRLSYDEYCAAVNHGLQLPEFSKNLEHVISDDIQGTVWDLVPGIKKSLYPHQQEAFEFIWRNVRGATKLDELDELDKPTKLGLGGCIICHAPGTGKTRLAITFLQSFIKQYPMSKPVIIGPRNMLLTWEEEFARWNVDVPFLNMNKPELSGREDLEVLKYAGKIKNLKRIRRVKLCSWAKGKGILGISYRLFEELAGERNDMELEIKRALLEQPGIVVLDEGHTPRNNDSNIWNVLKKVKTKLKIILSGTPFQNNFEELHNTLSLVREEFGNSFPLGGYDNYGKRNLSTERRGFMNSNVDIDRRIKELRKWMKPFVHVHKGEILKKTLRGLFHSVIFLNPSDLQKTCCQQLAGVKYIVELNHLVSLACVHPSILCSCKQVPEDIDKVLLEKHKADLDVGYKIRFLLELINLAVGEKVLVFNQYLDPLDFIADLLKSRLHWTEGKEFLYMDGQQDSKQRQSFINMFNDPNSEARVLLASTKACGEGIQLVGASRVVLLDVVWNPSVERQAISRAYRLGQQKDVYVYHLILSGTLEEKKYEWMVEKDRLSKMVFSSDSESRQMTCTLSSVSEDRILEEMIQNEKTNKMFANIIRESKADELIKSFNPVNP